MRVSCLEATGRVGGRIRTGHDPLASFPVELGAEFIHGRSPDIWRLIESAGLIAYERTARALYIEKGGEARHAKLDEFSEPVLARLAESERRQDESFDNFLRRSHQPAKLKNWARAYVEGFNAARKERISVRSLKQDAIAADEIEGDHVFKLLGGYDSLVRHLVGSIPDHRSVVRLHFVVEGVQWRRGRVTVHFRSSLHNSQGSLHAKRLIVTVPLGVLRAEVGDAGAIHFDPEPLAIRQAARSLEFGQVYRMTFRFRDPFWENDPRFRGTGFWLSHERLFPTWWTNHPVLTPTVTGWSAGPAADPLLGIGRREVVSAALASLAKIIGRKIPRPLAAYFHDWQADPFFGGAYSYVPVNAMPAREILARPVDKTLFFAGEATDTHGHGATVHGAISSGMRAARQVQEATA